MPSDSTSSLIAQVWRLLTQNVQQAVPLTLFVSLREVRYSNNSSSKDEKEKTSHWFWLAHISRISTHRNSRQSSGKKSDVWCEKWWRTNVAILNYSPGSVVGTKHYQILDQTYLDHIKHLQTFTFLRQNTQSTTQHSSTVYSKQMKCGWWRNSQIQHSAKDLHLY